MAIFNRRRGRIARHGGRNPVAVGALALGIIAALTYLGFTKDIPFTQPFQIKAVFQSANSIRPNSPVRIAGVNVGKVASVEAQEGSGAAVVTLQIKDEGLPIHRDATAKIRPRIFLEGNFFVDLKPGTPSQATLDDGDTIRITQTSTPVQLDQLLTALQTDTREDLKDLLNGLGDGLTRKPTAQEDADQDPVARGESAAESLNDGFDDAGPALRGTAVVNEALLGTEEGDLSRLVDGLGKVTGALGRNERQLQDFVSNFDTTLGAFAAEEANLRASVRELGPTLETANTALGSLNAALPAVRGFARDILPGVRETPATIDASFPWIAQTRRLLARTELQGLVDELSPATASLARLTARQRKLLPRVDLAARCARDVLLPTGDVVVQDEFPTGVENYKEFLYSLVGLSGEGQNFDGNGIYVRLQTGGGQYTTGSGPANGVAGTEQFYNAPLPVLGSRPKRPARKPVIRPKATCYKQDLADINGPAGAKGPADRLISGPAAAAKTAKTAKAARR